MGQGSKLGLKGNACLPFPAEVGRAVWEALNEDLVKTELLTVATVHD